MSGWLWIAVVVGGLLLVAGIVDWRRRYSVRGSDERDSRYSGPDTGGFSVGGTDGP
ncbi:MAG TPA: hypothetical protein VGD67_12295 [Pseudonocardiaceae bacterium]